MTIPTYSARETDPSKPGYGYQEGCSSCGCAERPDCTCTNQACYRYAEPDSEKWLEEAMQMINRLTPEIKGKAFDLDWFLLRQHLEIAVRHWKD